MIERLEGIPANSQTLICDGETLYDHSRFSSLSEIDVVVVFDSVEVVTSSGKPFLFGVSGKERVGEFKRRVSAARGLGQGLRLIHKGKVLADNKKLAPDSESVLLLQPLDILVIVRIDDCQVALPVNETDTVAKVKQQIEAVTGLSCDGMSLYFDDGLLLDGAAVRYAGVKEGATLVLREEMPIVVSAKTAGRPPTRVEINPLRDVRQLMSRLKYQYGKEIAWVLHCGRILKRSKTLMEAQVEDGATVEFGEVLLSVRRVDREVTLAVFTDIAIEALKEAALELLGLSAEGLKFLAEDEVLKDEDRLCSYKYKDRMTIEVIAPTDRFIWLKASDRKTLIHVPSFEVPLRYLLQQLSAQARREFAFVSVLMDTEQPLSYYSLRSGTVLEVYDVQTSLRISLTTSQRKISLLMKHSDCVATVTETLRREMGGRWDLYLSVKGRALDPSDYIARFAREDIIALSSHEQIVSFARTDGTAVSIICSRQEAVQSLRSKLSEQLSVSAGDLILRCHGKLLQDSESVATTGKQGSWEVILASEHFVWVREGQSRRRLLPLADMDLSVAQVKSQLPAFRLFSGVSELAEESKSLREYAVLPGARIKAIPADRCSDLSFGEKPDDILFARTLRDHWYVIRFEATFPWERMLEALSEHVGCRCLLLHRQKLAAGFSACRDSCTVQLIAETDEVTLVTTAERTIRVAAVGPSATVGDVKAALKVRSRLALHWRVLDDSRTLADCGVSACSLLEELYSDEQCITINRPGRTPLLCYRPAFFFSTVDQVLKALQDAKEADSSCALYYEDSRLGSDSPMSLLVAGLWLLSESDMRFSVVSKTKLAKFIYLPSSATVFDLKAAVSAKLEIFAFSLRYGEVVLADDRQPLAACGLTGGQEVALFLPDEVLVTLVHRDFRLSAAFSLSDKIEQVLAALPKKFTQSSLMYKREQLNQYKTLRDCGVTTDVEFEVITQQEQLLVCEVESERFSTVLPYRLTTLSALLTDSARGLELPLQSFSWSVALENDRLVSDYELQSGTTLSVVGNLAYESLGTSFPLQLRGTGLQGADLMVESWYTIEKVKSQIAESRNLTGLRLLVSGELPDDDSTLADLGITQSAAVKVLLPDEVVVRFTSPVGVATFATMDRQWRTAALKKEIERSCGLPQKLLRLFTDERELAENSSQSGTDVEVTLRVDAKFLGVKLGSSLLTVPSAFCSQKLPALKKKIVEAGRLKDSRLFVSFRGKSLLGEEVLATYGVGPGDILFAQCGFEVNFQTPLGSPFTLVVDSTETVENVKDRVAKRLRVHARRLRLVASGKLVSDRMVAQISRSSHVLKLGASLQTQEGTLIVLLEASGKRLPLHTRTDALVSDLRAQAESLVGQPIRLLLDGIPLEEDQSLSKAGLRMLARITYQQRT